VLADMELTEITVCYVQPFVNVHIKTTSFLNRKLMKPPKEIAKDLSPKYELQCNENVIRIYKFVGIEFYNFVFVMFGRYSAKLTAFFL